MFLNVLCRVMFFKRPMSCYVFKRPMSCYVFKRPMSCYVFFSEFS